MENNYTKNRWPKLAVIAYGLLFIFQMSFAGWVPFADAAGKGTAVSAAVRNAAAEHKNVDENHGTNIGFASSADSFTQRLAAATSNIADISTGADILYEDWDRSSLEFIGLCNQACGDITEISARICNYGDRDMEGTTTYEVWFNPSGNPKDGTVVSSGEISDLDKDECVDLAYQPAAIGSYMFKAYQRTGHPGTGELWSETCGIEQLECPQTCGTGPVTIMNSGFETPIVTNPNLWDIYPSGTAGLGWSVEWLAPNVNAPVPANLELQRNVNGWTPFEGSQYAELDADYGAYENEPSSVKIYQDIATYPGATYKLSFDFSPRPSTPATDNALKIEWGGNAVDTISADGSTNSNTSWVKHEYTLVSTGSSTRLAFSDAGTPNSLGTFLDDVKLELTSCEPSQICSSDSADWNDLDEIDIGSSTSMAAHSADSWFTDPGIGNYGQRDGSNTIAMVRGGGNECGIATATASFVLHNSGDAKKLSIRNLDGISKLDSFEVWINGSKIGTYTDDNMDVEIWKTTDFILPDGLGTILNVEIRSIDAAWNLCSTYGQVAFNWVKLAGCGTPWEPVPECGNGIIEDMEQCDDGNNTGGDGCSADCKTETIPVCGDGIINQTSETCDNGASNGQACTPPYGGSCSYCDTTCNPVELPGPYCGDGIMNGAEECDDGNTANDDECRNNCTLPVCEFSLDVMIVMDRSGSMGYDSPTRLSLAKTAANSFISELGTGDQSGLVSYANTATLDKMLSNDHAATQAAINSLTAYGATNIGDAINLANGELTSVRINTDAEQIMILLTDGKANKPNGPGSGEYGPDVTYAILKANEAAAAGIKIFTIGLGTNINAAMLQQIASTTGGEYYFAPDASDLEEIFTSLELGICGEEPKCGDGTIDASEQCDDGNNTGGDGCSADCKTETIPVCGDGIINQTSETCDNGASNGQACTPPYGGSCSYCDSTCKPVELTGPYCGDGIKNGAEECDDGNAVDNDECGNSCTLPVCEFDLDVMIVMDRSGSMSYDSPTRLSLAKIAANSFLGELGTGDQSGLVSYANTATLDKTLSNGHAATQVAINSLTAYGATNIGDAINLANGELTSVRINPSAEQIMILLTDGKANKPNGPGSGEYGPDVTYAILKANAAAAAGIKIFTIGLGTNINAAMLQQIASTTGGEYYFAPDASDLQAIFDNLKQDACQ